MQYAYTDGSTVHPAKDVVAANGVKHPARILTDWSLDELKTIGVLPYRVIYENDDPVLYVLSDAVTEISADEVVVTHGGVARPLADAKAEMIERTKEQARERLSHTDWYVTRLAEKATAIPATIATYRDAVREATDENEAAINAAGSISALAAIMVNWPSGAK